MPLAVFHIYSLPEFRDYLNNTRFSRKIDFLQNHHTWDPNYGSLTPQRDEMYWLESMRHFHIYDRGWSDIGQNLTTFPSGNIGLCRPIDVMPAGIFGANEGAICIENLGNFDEGKDVMTPQHKDTIVSLNAILCKKINLSPVKSQIVYHHWFDRSGERFPDDKINNNLVGDEQKTCPGTAFFGTNTIDSAESNFLPLIAQEIQQLRGLAAPPPVTKKVNTASLNVRRGPGLLFGINSSLSANTPVTIYAVQGEWSKISNTNDEWVFSPLLL
jgi:hypothetical protein